MPCCKPEDVYLSRGDAVNKADLLEPLITKGKTHLPAFICTLMDYRQGRTSLIHLILQIQVHVTTETIHLKDKGTNLDGKNTVI